MKSSLLKPLSIRRVFVFVVGFVVGMLFIYLVGKPTNVANMHEANVLDNPVIRMQEYGYQPQEGQRDYQTKEDQRNHQTQRDLRDPQTKEDQGDHQTKDQRDHQTQKDQRDHQTKEDQRDHQTQKDQRDHQTKEDQRDHQTKEDQREPQTQADPTGNERRDDENGHQILDDPRDHQKQYGSMDHQRQGDQKPHQTDQSSPHRQEDHIPSHAIKQSIIPANASSAQTLAAASKSSSNTLVEQRFLDRRRRLQSGCVRYRAEVPDYGRAGTFRGNFVLSKGRAFYCGIEKTGSTEWKILFEDMAKHNISVSTQYNWLRVLAGGLEGERAARDVLNPYKSAKLRFFFVREPWGRLVSAYVDKLFSPNIYFWQSVGVYIISKFRPQATELSLKCGHDVTFSEFITYVIDAEKTREMRDGHFYPQSSHCHICAFPYTHVGKLETAKEDRQLLLEEMKSPANFPVDYPQVTLRRQVEWYINDYDKYKLCITKDEALRRLWQKLKMRGFLLADMAYPLTPKESLAANTPTFTAMAARLINVSRERTENVQSGPGSLRDNKRLAVMDAFTTVSEEKKMEIQRLFHWDFELFGYDPLPEEVFGNNGVGGGDKKRRSLFDLKD